MRRGPSELVAAVLKILIGAVFIVSALSKFVTIDSFEMYVYSFGLFPLTACFYFSRLLIAAELLLGVSLVSHRNHRFTTVVSLLFLIFFICFLVYAQLIGRVDSCHCFGDLLPFKPLQSILKNAVMTLVLLFVYKHASNDWYPRWWLVIIIYLLVAAVFVAFSILMLHSLDLYSLVLVAVALAMALLASFSFYSRWWITVPLIVAPFVATFILSPPDSWYFREGDAHYDEELFMEDEHLSSIRTSENRALVAFFSPTCGFCRLSAEKISTVVMRNDIDAEKIVFVFPDGFEENRYQSFYERANSSKFAEVRIDKDLFVRVTRAAFPVILLVDNGEVKATYAYRSINEQEITDFLNNE